MVGWLVLATLVFAIAAPRALRPGLYYDEAFMGQQAKDFFEPGREVEHPASTRQVEILGRSFPLRNAVYLGALKSQLMLPSFALFGTGPRVLRMTSLAFGLLALLLAMLWAARVLGPAAALLGGLLTVLDPSWWFLSIHEWGPFTTAVLCRSAGFLLATWGWIRGRPLWTGLGGLALGLGVFSRADFAVVILASALALVAVRPGLVREVLRERRDQLAALAIGGLLGALPMWTSIPELLATTTSPVVAGRGDLGLKLAVLWSLADGSHFFRLIEAGGDFERLFDVDAPATGLGFAFLAAPLAVAGAAVARRRAGRRPTPTETGLLFVVLAALCITAGTAALPGAVRAHHLLNATPLFHLGVAGVLVGAWRSGRTALRGGAVAVTAALALGGALVIAATYDLIERTGGRGRWSDALSAVAVELESGGRGVSLDWGFHEQLFFLTREARLVEPIWDIPEAIRAEGAWRFAGGPGDVYLVHDADYDVFGYGPAFLAAARRVAERHPGAVELREHRDREGRLAFWTVRIARPHAIRYREVFRIELADAS